MKPLRLFKCHIHKIIHMFSPYIPVMLQVCRLPLLEFKDPVIKSVWTSCRIKRLSLRSSLAFSTSLNVRKINDDNSTWNNVITFSMVIFLAHKQMGFIYYWKIKQFNTCCLGDLLKQQQQRKKVQTVGDLSNIAAFILLSLHIVYLVAFSSSKANGRLL